MKHVGLIVVCLLLSVGSYGSDPYNLYYQMLLDSNPTETSMPPQTVDQSSVTITPSSVEKPVEDTPIVTELETKNQAAKELDKSPQDFYQDGSAIEYFMVDQRYKKNLKAQNQLEKRTAFKAKMDAIPSYHFLLANYAYSSNNSHNVGLTYGWCHAVGFYVNMMLGVNGFRYKADYKENYEAYLNSYASFYGKQLTNEHTNQRISITPGLLVRLGCPLYWNVGLGYAYTTQTHKAVDGRWAELTGDGIYDNGLCFQTGLVANIKGFSLMANYSFTGLDYQWMNHEIMIGLGYAIQGRKGGIK